MGKDKSKKRRRSEDSGSDDSSSNDSSSDSEREDVRHDKKETKKHKKSKDREKDPKRDKDSKSKRNSKSKSKEKSKDKDKDELVRQARAFLEQQLSAPGGSAGPASGPTPLACGVGAPAGSGPLPPVQVRGVVQHIGDEDYFRRHAEFSAFLAEERRTQFNELSSERSRELFSEFVQIWNEGRLAPRYYAGLVAAPKRRTEYRWNFAGAGGGAAARGSAAAGGLGRGGGDGGAATGMAAFMEDQRAQQAGARHESRRHDRAKARELLEEVAPRETGRDKVLAERAARRELARSRDDDGPGGFIPGAGRGGEDELMGGGDSFEAAKAREARRAESARQRGLARVEEVSQRAAAFAAKEEEKLAGLRALLAKGPITIAKRPA
ncbi:hypothetical protein VOLCADRAFT_96232 [Volvox carteri f. nagariensis]|uniref:Uncharacterized protein n=1 Tax=Volvox carteri f. nagariensis TaxID=3068 RepID=D8U9K2_VOLCA|nr:uncharacterized protein VOLCADRAFT_96232 [Volvox carteri f. nagariensis]EFJ43657.1 hypothetical protein VOLCADRAFT_96232 [Volvox carteri f. nagariensis]|eukprot:XP_002955357.1 hypothetical protein VOLCADRAFT_96232 [Volvox carteri f. nagariensis]